MIIPSMGGADTPPHNDGRLDTGMLLCTLGLTVGDIGVECDTGVEDTAGVELDGGSGANTVLLIADGFAVVADGFAVVNERPQFLQRIRDRSLGVLQ